MKQANEQMGIVQQQQLLDAGAEEEGHCWCWPCREFVFADTERAAVAAGEMHIKVECWFVCLLSPPAAAAARPAGCDARPRKQRERTPAFVLCSHTCAQHHLGRRKKSKG
jgi:hypothetical protein